MNRKLIEVTGELEDHLAELESRGKSVESITAGSPAEYMESLGQEMTNDYASWFKYIPIVGLMILAYSVMGHALNGSFEMNIIQVIGLPVIAFVSLIVYWALFRNMAKKEWTGKKSFFAAFFAVTLVMLMFLAVALSSMLIIDPLYVASPKMNIVIAIICALIFVIGAIWLQQWLAIAVPVLLFGPQIVFNFTSFNEEWKLFGAWIISMVLISIMFIVHLLILRKKELQYMSIQQATLNELDSLTELFDLYRSFYEQESNIEGAREFLKERLINKESVVFIAFDENNPIGFVQLYPSFSSVSMEKIWVLNDLYVKEIAREKGFAEELMKRRLILPRKQVQKEFYLRQVRKTYQHKDFMRKLVLKEKQVIFTFIQIEYPIKKGKARKLFLYIHYLIFQSKYFQLCTFLLILRLELRTQFAFFFRKVCLSLLLLSLQE